MIKPFVILLLGSSFGNKAMLPSSSYTLEAGVQRGSFRLGVDASHISQETRYPDFRAGSARFNPILVSFTVVPQIRSKVRPFVGVGWGRAWMWREINEAPMSGWKSWETFDDGQIWQLKGGLEYRLSKHTAIVLGVRQIYFQTKLTEHRQEFPLRPWSLDYQRTRDVNMDTLVVNAGLRVSF